MNRRFYGVTFLAGSMLGALAACLVSSRVRDRRSQAGAPGVRSKTISGSVLRAGERTTLFEPRVGSFVPVRDRRDFGGTRTVPTREVALFKDRRRQKATSLGRGPFELPPPGGLGAGVSFKQSLFDFKDETAVYFYNVAPASIGPQPHADLIYMTSSNTASKGCEALLSFFADMQYDCAFSIWDWAHPDVDGGGKFVKSYTYAEMTDYLIPYRFSLESGTELYTVCVYIANITRRLPSGSYQNEVYLYNHVSGTRDLMWSFGFEWPTKATDEPFWWGPIFETFPNPGAQYALASPLGFDQTIVIQDGVQYQMTDQDSTMTVPSGNGLAEVYRSQSTNSGLVCSQSSVASNEGGAKSRMLRRPPSFSRH